jgi:glutathione S-transferase
MKLYTGIGPNPRVVNMFLAEKGIALEKVSVDLMAGENRQGAHVARNPDGRLPTLELDDGTMLSEVVAICEYIEETHPQPALIGATAQERAIARMWTRRIDLNIIEPMTQGFRYAEGMAIFKDRMRLIPAAAADLKTLAQEKITWLDGLIAGRDFIAGPRITLADIVLFAFLDFGAQVGQPIVESNANIVALYNRMKARPSAAASVHV